jgi:broad specificity phosphatase PhoE
MTTVLFLVRHAAHDNLGGYLAGRMGGISLGSEGQAQAAQLAARMEREAFACILASPRERTRETGEAIARSRGLRVETDRDLDEIDFGSWSGQTFDELSRAPAWQRWNTHRTESRTPGGETMADVQRRVAACIGRASERFGEEAVVLVSHADVIKAAVCHVLGLSLEHWGRFEIAPASITTIVKWKWGMKLLGLNEVTP